MSHSTSQPGAHTFYYNNKNTPSHTAHTHTHELLSPHCSAQRLISALQWPLGLTSFVFAFAFWNFVAYHLFIRYRFIAPLTHTRALPTTHTRPTHSSYSLTHSFVQQWEACAEQSKFSPPIVLICSKHTHTHTDINLTCCRGLPSLLTFIWRSSFFCLPRKSLPLWFCTSDPRLLYSKSSSFFCLFFPLHPLILNHRCIDLPPLPHRFAPIHFLRHLSKSLPHPLVPLCLMVLHVIKLDFSFICIYTIPFALFHFSIFF